MTGLTATVTSPVAGSNITATGSFGDSGSLGAGLSTLLTLVVDTTKVC